jgi:hypothetical protein
MQWTISQIDQQFRDGKLTPTTAHWQCTHTDGDFTGSVYGTASVDGIKDVTTQGVLDHIWANGVSKDATEKACIDQAANQRIAAGAIRLNEAVSAPVPTEPLDQAKAAALAQVDDHHATVVNKLVGNPTQAEKDTWAMKLDTAMAISSASTPGVAGQTFLAAAGITTAEDQKAWAQVVLAKAAGYAGIVGVGEKLRATARQAIKAATTTAEINAALEASVEQTEAAVKAFLKA